MDHSTSTETSAAPGATSATRAMLFALLLGAGTGTTALAQQTALDPSPRPVATHNSSEVPLDHAQQALAAQRPVFIENKGQWDKQAKFLLRSPGLDIWITDIGVVYELHRIERTETRASPTFELNGREEAPVRVTRAAVVITYDGASASASATGSGRLQQYHNYYIGNDRTKWTERVALYSDARVEGLYSGVDAVFYLDDGRPRYDLVVSPGADPASIRMKVEGATSISVDGSGALIMMTALGTVEQRELFAYQEVDGQKRQVSCAFVASPEGIVRLNVGAYDRARPLVIDPIVYSTYLGGSGADFGLGIDVDASGNAYVTGYTTSTNFPTLNPASGALSGASGRDAFVTKFASGGALSFSTYIGGSNLDEGYGIAVDDSGTANVTGGTISSDFPTLDAAQGTYGGGQRDAFVTTLTSGGTLARSTFLGGSGYDEGLAIAVDDSGNAHVTGQLTSTDFPTLDAAQETYGGGQTDAFVTRLTTSGALSYSTFVGGSSGDAGRGIAVDEDGNAYVTGSTYSSNFPTVDAAQDSLAGGLDAFVMKLNSDGAVSFSTYLGGSGTMTTSGNDLGHGIDVDSSGRAYVTGQTNSSTFPTVNAAQVTYAGGVRDCFVTKLTTGGELTYSSFLGGSGDDYGNAIAVDQNGTAHVTGSTSSTNFPTRFAIQSSRPATNSAFVTSLTSDGALLASTYLGGSFGAEGFGIAADGSRDAFIVGKTSSSNFPTLNAAQGTYAGGGDAFVTKISPGTSIANVSVSSPRCVGGSASISWFSISVDSVNVDLSTDGGITWADVVAGRTNGEAGGSYVWTVPDAPGSNRKVRVASASDSSIFAVSDAFTILTAPTVTSEPVSNDPVCLGTPVSFSASASGPSVDWRWQISTDDGESFNDLEIDWSVYVAEDYGMGSTVLWIYDPQPSMHGDQFRVIFSNGCLPDTSAAATLRIGAPAISGRLFDDENGNCLQDGQERGLSGRIIEVTPGPIYTTTDSLGNYRLPVLPGEYSIVSAPLYQNPTCPEDLPISVTLSGCGETSTGNDIGVRADSGIYDLRVSIVGNRIRPGLGSDYYLKYINVGTEASAATLRLTYDSTNLTFVSSSATTDASSSNTLEWSLATLQPGDQGTIRVTMLAHTTAPVGSEICARADLDLPEQRLDESPLDNHDEACVSVTRSFDPNDKAVSPVVDACGRLDEEDTILAYQVRFQNTGSDTAFTVVIRDALDASLLDVSSLTMGAASHPYTWAIEAGNVLVIRFDDIRLPDSTSSEPNSHGVVKYTLHLRQDLAPGTAIPNSAAIYFDFNDPVITNEVVSRTPDFFITEHPADQAVVDGESATFSTAASGATNVQWQLSTDDGSTFDDIDGETGTSLLISASAVTMDGYRYRAVLTNSCDSAATDVATLHVEADDVPPVPDLETLPDLTGECSVTIGAAPTATTSDGETVEGTTDDPLTYSNQGTYTVHWTYDDGNSNIATQEQTVIIDDVTPPTLSVSVSPTSLWSPNGTMQTITITANAGDNCNAATWALSSISGNDGATSDDWSYTANTAPSSVQLRAERTGEGSGRTYTMSFTASDGHENSTTATCYVAVPHDQNGKVVAGRSRTAIAHGFMSDAAPNPFTAWTDIRFTLPIDGAVSVRIFDGLGRDVTELLRGYLSAGAHTVVWNGLRSDGVRATAGQYFYRIESDEMSETGSIMLVR